MKSVKSPSIRSFLRESYTPLESIARSKTIVPMITRFGGRLCEHAVVDRPSTPLEVDVPDAEEAEATMSPIEDTKAEEMQIAAPSGTLRSKDTAGLPSYLTLTLSQRLALSMARHPRRNLSLSLLLTLLASAVGVLLSQFKLDTSNLMAMYMTRGTEISNRVKQTETLLKQSQTSLDDLLAVDETRTRTDPSKELVCGGDWYSSRYVSILSCVVLHIHSRI